LSFIILSRSRLQEESNLAHLRGELLDKELAAIAHEKAAGPPHTARWTCITNHRNLRGPQRFSSGFGEKAAGLRKKRGALRYAWDVGGVIADQGTRTTLFASTMPCATGRCGDRQRDLGIPQKELDLRSTNLAWRFHLGAFGKCGQPERLSPPSLSDTLRLGGSCGCTGQGEQEAASHDPIVVRWVEVWYRVNSGDTGGAR